MKKALPYLFFGILWARNPNSTNRIDLAMEFVGMKDGHACLVPVDEDVRQDNDADHRFCYVPAKDFLEANPAVGDCVVVYVPSPQRFPEYTVHFIHKAAGPCNIPPDALGVAKEKLGIAP